MSFYSNDSSDPYFEADASANGFSLNAYRKANMLKIYLSANGNLSKIFQAYYLGNFSYNLGMDTGSYNEDMLSLISSLGVVGRSLVKNITKEFSEGSASAAFATPLKPYIKSTNPIKLELKCFLPLIDSETKEKGNLFTKNIVEPIDTLIAAVMPWKNKAFADAWGTSAKTASDAVDAIFKDDNSKFFGSVGDIIKGMADDFFGGMYMLNNPIQFDSTNNLVLRIGPWRLPEIIISNIGVEFSPLIYNDGTNVYPSYAIVTLSCTSKFSVTPDMLGVWSTLDSSSESGASTLKSLISKDSVTSET